MKTSDREELLRLLDEASDQFPEMRLGQLISNLATAARGADASATWDVTDKELIESAQRWLSRRSVATQESVG